MLIFCRFEAGFLLQDEVDGTNVEMIEQIETPIEELASARVDDQGKNKSVEGTDATLEATEFSKSRSVSVSSSKNQPNSSTNRTQDPVALSPSSLNSISSLGNSGTSRGNLMSMYAVREGICKLDKINEMMEDLFRSLAQELQAMVEWGDKMDHFYCLDMLMVTERHRKAQTGWVELLWLLLYPNEIVVAGVSFCCLP